MRKNRPILICATMGKRKQGILSGKSVFCEPFLRDDTIETTGAGDTFMACVLNAVLEKGLDSLTEDDLHEMLPVCQCGIFDHYHPQRGIEGDAEAGRNYFRADKRIKSNECS